MSTVTSSAQGHAQRAQAKWASGRGAPLTFWLGLGILIVAHVLLWVDVQYRQGVILPEVPKSQIPKGPGSLGDAARWMTANMTPICWLAYLIFFDGLLTWLARRRRHPQISSLRARPNRYVVAWLTSIPVWCFFDWVNFYFMDAWRYHGLPPRFENRFLGYFIAFAAISPGMFMAAQYVQELGLKRLRTHRLDFARRFAWFLLLGVQGVVVVGVLLILGLGEHHAAWPFNLPMVTAGVLALPALLALAVTRRLLPTAAVLGVSFTFWAIAVQDGIGTMTLWVGLIFLLDPLNAKLGGPSLLRDWQAGRWGRTFALMTGGAVCGLLWEFWNYWALSKWTYHLPFLGFLEDYRYFEMPLVGFQGFLPFALECWVVLITIVTVLGKLGLRVAEALPDEETVF